MAEHKSLPPFGRLFRFTGFDARPRKDHFGADHHGRIDWYREGAGRQRSVDVPACRRQGGVGLGDVDGRRLALLQIPDLPPIALLGLGSALGIIGSQYLEVLLRRNAKRLFGEK
jgi:hypothetical protein